MTCKMAYDDLDNEFFLALQNPPERRNEKERNIIYSGLRHLNSLSNFKENVLQHISGVVRLEFHDANEILYRKDDLCDCWYILLSGSIFIQGSMFLPFHCFGKQIPGTKRRNCQCIVLEQSEMLAIDYPDVAIHGNASGIASRPHALRRGSGNSANDRVTVNHLLEADTSSCEASPLRQKSNTLPKTSNGQIVLLNDIESQSSTSKDPDDYDDDSEQRDLDEEDSLSLHSSSSFQIKDLVIEVLKKDIESRTVDDIEMLMEFTKSLVAFSNMTESVRKSLCKAMVFAWVEHAGTTVLKDNELLDSWSVIINGQVQITNKDGDRILDMGETFGVAPTMDSQYHKGTMVTLTDDCQFLCIPQPVYCDLVQLGRDNIELIQDETGEVVMVMEKREIESASKFGTILIRGTADSLTRNMLEENATDPTYTEDFLLTYRAFIDCPNLICSKLLDWFDDEKFRVKVSKIVLLWVNNHFNDFERDGNMMNLLEHFEAKLTAENLHGESKLLGMACATKAKPRVVALTRPSSDVPLDFTISGASNPRGRHQPIYISSVQADSEAEEKGVKRGDQLLEVNGQNFEKISYDGAMTILNKNTELNLTLKTNLFAFKESTCEQNFRLSRKNRKSKHHSLRDMPNKNSSSDNEIFDSKQRKGGTMGRAARKFSRIFKKDSNNFEDYIARHGGGTQGTVDDSFLTIPRKSRQGNSATIDLAEGRPLRHSANLSHSDPDLLEPSAIDFLNLPATDAPEDVIKVYNAEQSFRFLFVNEDTTAGDVVARACKEFGIAEELEEYALYRVSVQSETSVVKQSKLPDPWSKLAEIPLGARYYLKKNTYSDQLLPDENISELLKEANFSFLDLNCFEVALYLTREDYKLFQLTEPTNFIDDLFRRNTELKHFKDFEDLVNRELFWVVTTICSEGSALLRSKIIKHFIKIAHHCKVLKNFNSTFALVSGLGYRAVSRMKQAWEKVPQKSTRLFDELQALMDPSRNMSKYRTLLNDYLHQPPVIPYIPVVKKDLTFLHLGNDTKVNGLINFEKMRMIAKEVRNIHRLCSADKSQIIPTATLAQQKETEKSAIYQTLVRRNRRASLNNLRKIYEDQLNVRRVRQYMKQMNIITDEDKLMELSKLAEPPSGPSSAPTKRRNTSSALPTDSPSRSSRTLPNQPGRSASAATSNTLQLRNNSDPHLASSIAGMSIQGLKKKTPTTTLPKFASDLHSPQMISRKLMSLSEEAGAEEKKNRGKKGKETKRSASVSSHDFSPSSSPYLPAKHDNSKQADSNHTVASENTNRNNNRISTPSGASVNEGPPPVTFHGVVKRSFPPHGSSASSCRSSIASASSLGTMSSSSPSTPSLAEGGYSPRSSPVSCGSNPSLAGYSTKAAHPGSSPSRSSSGSSADTVKAAAGRFPAQERPIIKQLRNSRSISYGGGNMSSINERMFQHMSPSSSSPALNMPAILPNHPRIPRIPSNDSGVYVSSQSIDSFRNNPTDEGDPFPRPNHHIHPSSARPPTIVCEAPSASNRRVQQPQSSNIDQRQAASPRQSERPRPTESEEENNDKVEQTFLSGCRGSWDTPRLENKDPINSPASGAHVPLEADKLPPNMLLHPNHVPPGSKPPQRYPNDKTVFGKGSVKNIHEFLVVKRQVNSHAHYRANANNNNNAYNPVMLPNYTKVMRAVTPDAMLEEQLVRELRTQKPNHYYPRKAYASPEFMVNQINLKRLSLTTTDSSIGGPPVWSAYSVYPGSEKFASGHPINMVHHKHPSSPGVPPLPNHTLPANSQHYRPSTLNNSPHRGLNHEEALVMSAYDQVKNCVFTPQHGAVEIKTTYSHGDDQSRTNYIISPDGYHQKQKRFGAHQHPPSPVGHPEFCRDPTATVLNSNGHQGVQDQYVEGVSIHARRKSQDWNETELDSSRHSQTKKTWGSSTSLSSTTASTKFVSPQSSELPPQNLQPDLLINKSPEKKAGRPPPPPPPQRTTSRLQTAETNGFSNTHSSSPVLESDSAFSHRHDDVTCVKANGHAARVRANLSFDSSSPILQSTNQDRRSLPTYNEALHQIQSKHAIHNSSISNSFRSFPTDNRDKEQVSQV